jgi:general secretion pathway protein K
MSGSKAVGHSRGFALLIVLWALVPLAFLFMTLAVLGRRNAELAFDVRAAATLEAAADGAVNTGIFDILRNGIRSTRQVVRLPGASVALDILPLSGLVNPNDASAELLRALFHRLGVADPEAASLASAIVDWRTPGQSARPGGARALEYRQAGLSYAPPGAPFESLDELGLVLRMSPSLQRALEPYMSIYAGTPDPAVAPPVVRDALQAIGILNTSATLDTQVVQITATAIGAGPARTVRRAIVRFAPSATGRNWRVLSWQTVPDPP